MNDVTLLGTQSSVALDRAYPHQVALYGDSCEEKLWYCLDLFLCPVAHSFVAYGIGYIIFAFRVAIDADLVRTTFGGRPFHPTDHDCEWHWHEWPPLLEGRADPRKQEEIYRHSPPLNLGWGRRCTFSWV